MTTFPLPQCLGCLHYDPESEPEIESCSAFPNGIPRQIWQGEADHRDPYRGDGGIRFEQDPGKPPFDFELFRIGERSG